MTSDPDRHLELYKLFVGTTEKVSDRRAKANAWMLGVNGAIVGLQGVLDRLDQGSAAGTWAIPVVGLLICVAWELLLRSYRILNRAKFAVLQEMEAGWPVKPFTEERRHYRREKRIALSHIEKTIPVVFGLFYVVLLVVQIWA